MKGIILSFLLGALVVSAQQVQVEVKSSEGVSIIIENALLVPGGEKSTINYTVRNQGTEQSATLIMRATVFAPEGWVKSGTRWLQEVDFSSGQTIELKADLYNWLNSGDRLVLAIDDMAGRSPYEESGGPGKTRTNQTQTGNCAKCNEEAQANCKGGIESFDCSEGNGTYRCFYKCFPAQPPPSTGGGW